MAHHVSGIPNLMDDGSSFGEQAPPPSYFYILVRNIIRVLLDSMTKDLATCQYWSVTSKGQLLYDALLGLSEDCNDNELKDLISKATSSFFGLQEHSRVLTYNNKDDGYQNDRCSNQQLRHNKRVLSAISGLAQGTQRFITKVMDAVEYMEKIQTPHQVHDEDKQVEDQEPPVEAPVDNGTENPSTDRDCTASMQTLFGTRKAFPDLVGALGLLQMIEQMKNDTDDLEKTSRASLKRAEARYDTSQKGHDDAAGKHGPKRSKKRHFDESENRNSARKNPSMRQATVEDDDSDKTCVFDLGAGAKKKETIFVIKPHGTPAAALADFM